jgi:hypothetical protein
MLTQAKRHALTLAIGAGLTICIGTNLSAQTAASFGLSHNERRN